MEILMLVFTLDTMRVYNISFYFISALVYGSCYQPHTQMVQAPLSPQLSPSLLSIYLARSLSCAHALSLSPSPFSLLGHGCSSSFPLLGRASYQSHLWHHPYCPQGQSSLVEYGMWSFTPLLWKQMATNVLCIQLRSFSQYVSSVTC